MKKVIFSQVMTDNGTAEFSGVYDRNGLPVKIILEADNDGIVLTAVRRKLTDIELMEIALTAAKTAFFRATAMTREAAINA